jgi:hypothetical protein
MRLALAELAFRIMRQGDRPIHILKPNRNQPAKRRSIRMPLNARIALSGHDREKHGFTISTIATNLNRYGGAIQLNRELSVGSTVVVRNAHGAQAPARIATQSAFRGIYTYGIEFLEGDTVIDFWGITFPTQT